MNKATKMAALKHRRKRKKQEAKRKAQQAEQTD